ncbi:MAG TPA: hypothetical protein PKY77_18405 [Phycisphaerae bacterium]|nr:hypothetical protein [Phycisphaerae bacterium]HRY70276.1 hypothetical protein [Phycisphaerae bacterium]HSA27553.1 hypothetical protein [Phycisphaerae bacterium]
MPAHPAALPPTFELALPATTHEDCEYLVVRSSAGANAIALVTVENGAVDLQYGTGEIGKGQQLQVVGRFTRASYRPAVQVNLPDSQARSRACPESSRLVASPKPVIRPPKRPGKPG